ncbi:calcineurin catalytic subunit a [Anaeramoeba flamelloides]|uniref:Calcineurin catalytic subunit a n=1 Tax=Anaeramoeba flamelloides TaxID=1746091 RepID=A0AAV7ZUN1_9EUKA|nr:calcineurin catalytic subunit a [Anaeramoeba flamelloides]
MSRAKSFQNQSKGSEIESDVSNSKKTSTQTSSDSTLSSSTSLSSSLTTSISVSESESSSENAGENKSNGSDSNSNQDQNTSSESEISSDYERGKVNCGDDRQIKKARELVRERLSSEILFPNQGNKPNSEAVFKHFKREGKLFKEDILKICKQAQKTLRKEPNLLRISSPVLIIGDLHGQFFDLVSIIEAVPSCKQNKYHFLFLGDYIDRGNYGVEILLNHETRELSKFFNFKSEVLLKYDEEIYDSLMKTCECLPLAAIVDNQFFCVHAGISPHLSDVEMINKINRFKDPPLKGLLTDLLWSDPFSNYNLSEGCDQKFIFNTMRRCSFQYSYDAVIDFLIENDLTCVIRAHEAQNEGYQMYKKWEETNLPSLITIFSAPNYSDMGNKGAVLQYKDCSVTIKEFKKVNEPYSLPDLIDVFTWSIPFITEKILAMWSTIKDLKDEEFLFTIKIKEQPETKKEIRPKLQNNKVSSRDFLNRKRNINIKNKVLVTGKLISALFLLRKEQQLKIKKTINTPTSSKLLRSRTFNIVTNTETNFTTSEQIKFIKPTIPKFYRSISHESQKFQQQLLKGYRKIWLETNKNHSLFQPKAVYNFNDNQKIQQLDNKEIQLLKKINNRKINIKSFSPPKRTDMANDIIEIMKLNKVDKNSPKKSSKLKKAQTQKNKK